MSNLNASLSDIPEEKENKKLPRCKVGEKSCMHYKPGKRCGAPLTKILIDEERGKPNYETIGVNGYVWQIKRGDVVELPSCAVGVLENAVGTRYVPVANPTTGHDELHPRKHSAIPWRIVR